MTIPSSDANTWPTEIRLSADKTALTVAFDTGETFQLPAELLRVCSPSAEVQGHSPDQRRTVAGKRGVHLTGVEQVGRYAVRLIFDDTHETGIYTWGYLLDLGRTQDAKWAAYLGELAEKGLSRD
jgi:DUF971 family protein